MKPTGDTNRLLARIAEAGFDSVREPAEVLAGYSAARPLRLAMFRGGRGASQLTSSLAALPNLSVQIVLGATDDGRSWYHAASDFAATGVPDAGKSLLDLAHDESLKSFLGARLKARENLDPREAFDRFVAILQGDDRPAGPGTRELLDLFKRVEESKRGPVADSFAEFARRYPAFRNRLDPNRASSFSFDNIPMRSIALVGAAWRHGGDWQRAANELGELLDTRSHRVLFPTAPRLHLVAMTADGVIYFAETGVNEHPKQADFLGLWLMEEKPDIADFTAALADKGVMLEKLASLDDEIEETARRIVDVDSSALALAADLIAARSCSVGASAVTASPDAVGALATADVIVYAPTTLESNIGSALVVPGIRRAIRDNRAAAKIHFVNPTVENDPPGTTAVDMVSRLARYASGQQAYRRARIDWREASTCVDFGVGIDKTIGGRDENKTYIPFDHDEIRRQTGGNLHPVPLDLESATPLEKQSKDYRGTDLEFGFYDPSVMQQTIIALLGIKLASFDVKSGAGDQQQ